MSLSIKNKFAELKKDLLKAYEQLSQCVKKRDFENIKQYESRIEDIEKLFTDDSIHIYECECESDKDSDEGYEDYQRGRSISCLYCLRKFINQERQQKYLCTEDQSDWDSEGALINSSSSEESVDTSSDDEEPKLESYHRQKLLRKLRRKGPDEFLLKYFTVGVEALMKIECQDDKIKQLFETKSSHEFLAERECLQKPTVSKLQLFDVYTGGSYDPFDDETMSPKLLQNIGTYGRVIVAFQRYLKEYPMNYYANLGEVIVGSGEFFIGDKDSLVHYYNAIHVKPPSPESNNSENYEEEVDGKDCSVSEGKLSYCSSYKDAYPMDFSEIPIEEVVRAKRTGVLKLRNKSLTDLPQLVWFIDKVPIEYKVSGVIKRSVSSYQRSTDSVEPLREIDLSCNKITKVEPHGTCLNTLYVLDLSNNKLTKLSYLFKYFTCLKFINLSNNQITKIPNSFSRITTLRVLILHSNCIKSLSENIRKLKSLELLELRWNKLKQLPDSICELTSLKVLDVGYNKLTSIPSDIEHLTSLKVLDISYNRITHIPSLSGLEKMIVFNASGNYIKEFPVFTGCISLCEVRMDGNRIKYLCKNSTEDVPIIQLTLSYNKIKEIPDSYSNLEIVVLLDLTANNISQLPCYLARLKYLSCLKVESNPLQNITVTDYTEGSKKLMNVLMRNLLLQKRDKIDFHKTKTNSLNLYTGSQSEERFDGDPSNVDIDDESEEASYRNLNLKGQTAIRKKWLGAFIKYQVSSLDLSGNSLGWFPFNVVDRLKDHLTELYISKNCFKIIPEFVGKLYKLTILDLNANHLKALPKTISYCPLKKISCRYNNFTEIPDVLYLMPTIEYLDFSYNDISAIDVDGLRELSSLNFVDLSFNVITNVPTALGFLVNLKTLNLENNSFDDPGENVLEMGTADVLSYLRGNDKGGQEVEYLLEKQPTEENALLMPLTTDLLTTTKTSEETGTRVINCACEVCETRIQTKRAQEFKN